MGTVEENRRHWSSYDWSRRGEEWSETWGNSAAQWWGTLFPRIRPFLPCRRGLEIASGAGRWSVFLAEQCDRLDLVDLTPACVESTRQLFAGRGSVASHLNDGRSLPMIGDRSVDFAFSFDSLVHVELDVVTDYCAELARVLSPEGAAFLHHSNFAALLASPPEGLQNLHWRAESVSAERLAAAADAAGLACVGQELVNWGSPWLSDCFTLLTPKGSRWERPNRRVENPHFMESAHSVRIADAALGVPAEPPSARARGARGGWLGAIRAAVRR